MIKRQTYLVPLVALAVVVAALAVYLAFFSSTAHAPEVDETKGSTASTKPPVPNEIVTPQKPTYDTTTASSVQVVVNKQHPMSPLDYAPDSLISVGNGQQLRTEAGEAFLRMQTDAAAAGSPFSATSGYRSYSYQKTVYNGYVARYGVAETDTFSARPGYSEHQTGVVVDIEGGGCRLDNCFANTAQGTWLATHAYKYGYILRYPADKTDITGYMHEAWHWRYVGTELATDMHEKGITTLEEYFDVPGGTSYH